MEDVHVFHSDKYLNHRAFQMTEPNMPAHYIEIIQIKDILYRINGFRKFSLSDGTPMIEYSISPLKEYMGLKP